MSQSQNANAPTCTSLPVPVFSSQAVWMFIVPIYLSTKHSFHPPIHPSILPPVQRSVHLFARNIHPSLFQDPTINDKIRGSLFFSPSDVVEENTES